MFDIEMLEINKWNVFVYLCVNFCVTYILSDNMHSDSAPVHFTGGKKSVLGSTTYCHITVFQCLLLYIPM